MNLQLISLVFSLFFLKNPEPKEYTLIFTHKNCSPCIEKAMELFNEDVGIKSIKYKLFYLSKSNLQFNKDILKRINNDIKITLIKKSQIIIDTTIINSFDPGPYLIIKQSNKYTIFTPDQL
jgi:hypothetical protein